MKNKLMRERVLAVSGSLFSAGVDQASFLGGNVVALVLLARWMPVSDFGLFSLLYGGLLLFLLLHGAMVSEPAVVFGAGRFSEARGLYFHLLVRGHMRLSAGLAIIALATVAATGVITNAWSLHALAIALAAASIGLATLLRRLFYVVRTPERAVSGSVVYAVLVVSGTTGLHAVRSLTVQSALIALFLAGCASSAVSWRRLAEFRSVGERAQVSMRDVLLSHWHYGAWAAGTAVLLWLSTSGFLYLLLAFHGVESAGVFRMVQNLVNPFTQAVASAALLLLPALARQTTSIERHMRMVKWSLWSVLTVGACALVVVWFAGPSALRLVYGSDTIVPPEALLAGCVYTVAAAALTVVKTALRSKENSRAAFVVSAFTVVPLMVVGIEIVRRWETIGAFAAMAVISVAGGVFMWYVYVRRYAEGHDPATGRPDRSMVDGSQHGVSWSSELGAR